MLWSLFDFLTCAKAGWAHVPANWELSDVARLAVAAHINDRDDIHWPSVTHPGGVIWPAVLCFADRVRADPTAIARAASVGHEVMIRLGLTLGPEHRQYWHATASCGVAGVSAASAALLSSDPTVLANAIGHGTSIAGGSARAIAERSGTRYFHRAHAVNAGIAAGRAALAGIEATRRGLEHENGILRALRAGGDLSATLDQQREPAIAETSPRFAAASGWALAAVDAASSLGKVDVQAVDEIVVAVTPPAIALAGNAHPETDEEAWWSIPHAVAVVLATGTTSALADGRNRTPHVQAALERLRLEGTRDNISALVTVLLRGSGQPLVAEGWPRGHANNPASVADRIGKWEVLVGTDGHEHLELVSKLLSDTSPPASRLLQLIGSGASDGPATSR